MRILVTIHQFFPQYKAGTEILTLSVVKELIRRGHVVRIFTGHPKKKISKNEIFDEYQYEGIHIYRFYHSYDPIFNQTSMIDLGYKNKLAEYYFTEVCESFQPQLVYHFHLNRLGIKIIFYLAKIGIAQYFIPTDFWMICPTAQLVINNSRFCYGPNRSSGNCVKHFAQNSVNRFIASIIQILPDVFFDKLTEVTKKYHSINYPMSHEVIAMSHRIENTIKALNKLQGIISPNSFMSKLFIKYGVNRSIIYNRSYGVYQNTNFASNKYKNWLQNKPLKIVFIGTLAPYKGCDIAIKAINLLPDNFAQLTIFGSGENFPSYVSKLFLLAKGNKNIFFREIFSNYKIFSVLDKFDVLIVPSFWFENNPLVIYYAQAVNCPVIGSNVPGISSVISHRVNGLLFKAGDYKDLYKQIKYLRHSDLSILSRRSIKPKTLHQYVDDIYNIWDTTHQ